MKSLKINLLRIFKSTRVEIISNNIIDKDVQSMLLPLDLLQIVQFCPKYCIKDNFISPNSRLSNFISLCATMFFILHLSYYVLYITIADAIATNQELFIFILLSSELVFVCTGFIMTFFLKILRTSENITLVLKFQDIHRHLNNDKKFKRFIIVNWFAVVSLSMFSIGALTFCGIMVGISIGTVFTGVILLGFDANIFYCIRVIQLLKDKIDLWNLQVFQHKNMEDREIEEYCKVMFQAYVHILDCFDIYKGSFQQIVSHQEILIHDDFSFA